MVATRMIAWITQGFIDRGMNRFAHYQPSLQPPAVTPVESSCDSSNAMKFGEELGTPAEILLVMTHGAAADGAGPGVISPKNTRTSWGKKYTIEECLKGFQRTVKNSPEIQAKGIIDLACNRNFEDKDPSQWKQLGASVEWVIAAKGNVTDNGTGRALEAAVLYGHDQPQKILKHLRRWVPKSEWGIWTAQAHQHQWYEQTSNRNSDRCPCGAGYPD